jgi:hypothetical protein
LKHRFHRINVHHKQLIGRSAWVFLQVIKDAT